MYRLRDAGTQYVRATVNNFMTRRMKYGQVRGCSAAELKDSCLPDREQSSWLYGIYSLAHGKVLLYNSIVMKLHELCGLPIGPCVGELWYGMVLLACPHDYPQPTHTLCGHRECRESCPVSLVPFPRGV